MTHHHSQTFHNAGRSSLSLEGGNTVFSLFIRHCLIKYPTSLVTFVLLKYSTSFLALNIPNVWMNKFRSWSLSLLSLHHQLSAGPTTIHTHIHMRSIKNQQFSYHSAACLWIVGGGQRIWREPMWTWGKMKQMLATNQQNKFLHIIIIILFILWKDDWASFIHSS